jgi:hypothetical protein
MKNLKLFFLSLILILSFSTGLNAEFFSDVIVTNASGIWTDSRAYSTLNAAITAVGANTRTVKIVSPQVVTNLTVPSNVTLEFDRNGSITNSGQLTINTNNIIAPNRQIFTGVGNIDFASGTIVQTGWFSNIETAFALTGNDTITLIVSKAQTITASYSLGNSVNLKWDSPGNILTVNAGITVSNIGHVEAGNYQLFAGAGNFRFRDGTELNLSWFPTLRTAITWISTNTVTLISTTPSTVGLTDTSPVNISFKINNGGILTLSGGVALTISGDFSAGLYQAFAGAGTVSFGNVREVYPEWWGALGNGTTNDTVAIQAAHDRSVNSGFAEIVFQSKTYLVSTGLTWSPAVPIVGLGNATLTTTLASGKFLEVSTQYGNTVSGVSGYNFIKGTIKIINTNAGNTATAMFLGQDANALAYSAAYLKINGLVIQGFTNGIKFGSNTYINTFSNITITACVNALVLDGTGYTNRLEKISFIGSLFSANTLVMHTDTSLNGDIHFISCSFDYNSKIKDSTATELFITMLAPHIEYDSVNTQIAVVGLAAGQRSVLNISDYLLTAIGSTASPAIAIGAYGTINHKNAVVAQQASLMLFQLTASTAILNGDNLVTDIGGGSIIWTNTGAGSIFGSGTFTPTLTIGGTGISTYARRVGRYTLIGNRIFFSLVVQANGLSALTGAVAITGLPALSNTTVNTDSVCNIIATAMNASITTNPVALITSNSTSILIYKFATGGVSAVTDADLTANAFFFISGQFEIN